MYCDVAHNFLLLGNKSRVVFDYNGHSYAFLKLMLSASISVFLFGTIYRTEKGSYFTPLRYCLASLALYSINSSEGDSSTVARYL
ncbi:hypothetical protein BDU57DRAFT_519805 [Ampelomyces quisqualis]|uniref:Uncharacterized protein n=1 Tax=Ampelomyces quisqualis TaxID=50730 RepID=A0A6A5QGN2_AMPQU|nr:hypothetical protein BDU57DRAFT_519805 [Ampelomyces quisqualis]